MDLLKKEGFPTADEVKDNLTLDDHLCYSVWLKKAKKNIIVASRKNMSYCFFHLKYYINDRYDHVYASLVDKELKVLNPINDKAESDAKMLIGLLDKLGYSVTPFVGEKPFEMSRCNMSTKQDDVFVGHGALGLYVTW